MIKKYLPIIIAASVFTGSALVVDLISNAENRTETNATATEASSDALPEYMQFDSSVKYVSSNKVTANIELLQGNTELENCSIVFSVTFEGQKYPCEITTPSGQRYAITSVDAYNTSEITGLGIIEYYRIDNIELGTYTITSDDNASIFNVSVDMGVTETTEFIIDKNSSMDESMAENVMTQDEYDSFVEEIIESESIEEDANKNVITPGGINLEGQIDDVDASSDHENSDNIDEYNKKLQSELDELTE